MGKTFKRDERHKYVRVYLTYKGRSKFIRVPRKVRSVISDEARVKQYENCLNELKEEK
jgi:23S rRNA maturation mini-RNase III